jgi:hypothetical protein
VRSTDSGREMAMMRWARNALLIVDPHGYTREKHYA